MSEADGVGAQTGLPRSQAGAGEARFAAVTRVRTVDFAGGITGSTSAMAWSSPGSILDEFRCRYQDWGYAEQAPAQLISRVDPSVRFIGSAISVLKPFLAEGSIPTPGVFIVQPAIRTRNLGKLLDGDVKLTSPSFFLHLGALSPPGCLELAASHAWAFFKEQAGGRGNGTVVMRISSQDRDLQGIARGLPDAEIEIDGEDQERYRHVFGMGGVTGRNLNYAVRHVNGRTANFGNLIVIEDAHGPRGVETAIGLHHLVAALFGLGHPIMATPVAAAVPIGSHADVKFADALVASTALVDAGLRPTGRGRGRTLRGYLQALAALRREGGVPVEDLERAVAYLLTGPDASSIAVAIRQYVEADDQSVMTSRARAPGSAGTQR